MFLPKRTHYLWVLLLFIWSSHAILANNSPTAVETPSVRQLVQLIEDQRILSQQAVKCFVGLTVNNKIPNFYIELDSSRLLFEDRMQRIELFTPGTSLENLSKELRIVWNQFKVQTKKGIDKEEAELLLNLNNKLLIVLDEFYNDAKNYKNNLLPEFNSRLEKIDQLAQLAHNQRLYAEEYLIYYFAKKVMIRLKGKNKRFSTGRVNFEQNLKELMNSSINSSEIDAKAHLVKAQWDEFTKYLNQWNPKSRLYMKNLCQYHDWSNAKINALTEAYYQLSEAMSINELINLASLHRAQSQELSKFYTVISFDYNFSSSLRKNLQKSIDAFETRSNHLYLYAPTSGIQASVNTVNSFWKNYKKILTAEYSEANIFKLIEQSHIIMAACDKVAEQIEAYAKTIGQYNRFMKDHDLDHKITNVVNLSGAQCMDLQRLPIYYMLLSKNMGGSTTKNRYFEILTHFEHSLQKLEESSINNTEIENLLGSVSDAWQQLKENVLEGSIDSGTETIKKLIIQTDVIYKMMSRICDIYAQEVNKTIMRKLQD